MTKKDYEAIARALKDAREAIEPDGRAFDVGYLTASDNAATALASALAHDSPRFDRARFLRACGVAE